MQNQPRAFVDMLSNQKHYNKENTLVKVRIISRWPVNEKRGNSGIYLLFIVYNGMLQHEVIKFLTACMVTAKATLHSAMFTSDPPVC